MAQNDGLDSSGLDESIDDFKALEPIRDGVEKLAREVVTKHKSLTQDMETRDKTYQSRLDELESKVNRSVEDVVVRVERLRQGSGVINAALGLISPSNDGLLDAIPKSVKERAGMFDAFARNMPRTSVLADGAVCMAVSEWFRRSTRSQLRKFASTAHEDAQVAEKLFEALQEKQFGTDWRAIQKAAMQEDTASEGGNLVPTIVEADIIRQVKDAAKLFPRARQVQMTKKVHQVPSETTAVTVNWVAEEGTLTQGEPNVGQKTLTALKLAGRAKMSIELVEDSNVGLLAYLLEVFTEKMGGEIDKQMVCGDGSSPAITGIDNTSGVNVVATSATAAGRNLSWTLLVSTFVASGESSAIENGVWIVSPKGYAAIIGLQDSTGQPVVRFGQAEGAPAGTLIGRPIIMSARFGGTPSGVTATLDDTTNANTKIIYGVPTSLLAGTRQGMRWDVTDQVSWATYQIDARLVGRFAMVVGVPANFSRISKVNTV